MGMNKIPAFLRKNEYASTKGLITRIFGQDDEFMAELYGDVDEEGCSTGLINDGLIAAIHDEDGNPCAMVMVVYRRAVPTAMDDAGRKTDQVIKHTDTHSAAAQVSQGMSDSDDSKLCNGRPSDGKACDSEAADSGFTGGYKVPYIMGVCTLEQYRHQGFMDALMKLVIERLKSDGYPWCFLVAVDTAIYRHLGFTHDWKLTDEERDLLYADDGLDTASGRLLNADSIEPVRITRL